MKTALWYSWEPGLYGDYKTSGGGGTWTSFLWKEMERNGFEIKRCSPPIDAHYDGDRRIDDVKDIDAAIFCWRWLLPPQYAERNQYYEWQMALIRKCFGHHIPILIHDQDHKIEGKDEKYLQSIGAILTAPEIYPRYGFKTLMFPNPYSIPPSRPHHERPIDLMYVGNNYERYNQFKKMVGGHPNRYTVVYGNWLEKSPNREDPEQIKQDCPYIDFRNRLPQTRVLDELRFAKATFHLAKYTYCTSGFITIRWAEAVAAGCPAFIPAEFRAPIGFYRAVEISNMEKWLDDERMLDVLFNQQREFVATKMIPSKWLEILDSMIGKH